MLYVGSLGDGGMHFCGIMSECALQLTTSLASTVHDPTRPNLSAAQLVNTNRRSGSMTASLVEGSDSAPITWLLPHRTSVNVSRPTTIFSNTRYLHLVDGFFSKLDLCEGGSISTLFQFYLVYISVTLLKKATYAENVRIVVCFDSFGRIMNRCNLQIVLGSVFWTLSCVVWVGFSAKLAGCRK